MKQEMMEWQWHQLDHMQIICTSLQADNHASTSSLNFLQARCSSWCPTNSVKALKAIYRILSICWQVLSPFYITSAKEDMYSSLFVCQQLCLTTSKQICMKFSGKVGNGPMNKWLNFRGDPDHRSGSVSRHW